MFQDFIQYLPEGIRKDPIYKEVVELMEHAVGYDYPDADKLINRLEDVVYKYKNFNNLQPETLNLILEEMGYGYIKDIMDLSKDNLKNILGYLSLLHIFKGSRYGLETVLRLLDLEFEIIEWWEKFPQGEIDTFELKLFFDYLNSLSAESFDRLDNFISNYVYPICRMYIYYRMNKSVYVAIAQIICEKPAVLPGSVNTVKHIINVKIPVRSRTRGKIRIFPDVTPSRLNLIPPMINNNSEFGQVIYDSNDTQLVDTEGNIISQPWKACSHNYSNPVNVDTWRSANTVLPHWIGYQFKKGKARVDGYSVAVRSEYIPTSIRLEGSANGVDWDILDTQTGMSYPMITDSGHKQVFAFQNNTFYSVYRIVCLSSKLSREDDTPTNIVEIEEIELYGDYSETIPIPVQSDLIPVMTHYGSPYGQVTASSESTGKYAYYAFDNNINADVNSWEANSQNAWIQYKFLAPARVDRYSIITHPDFDKLGSAPKEFRLYGSNNGGSWIELDYRYSVNWGVGEEKSFTILNPSYYQFYKLEVVSTMKGNPLIINELQMFGVMDAIQGTSGNDTLSGTSVADVILGYEGNDTITRRGDVWSGKDIVVGGKGDDIITHEETFRHGAGSNADFIFNLGDGKDTYTAPGDADYIYFGDGIKPSNLEFDAVEANLIIKIKDNNGNYTGDQITILNHFDRTYWQIERLCFKDGSVMYIPDILNKVQNITGTEGSETIEGSWANENIKGLAGDDKIYADSSTRPADIYTYNSADTIEGGLGNDTIHGGADDDTYVFNRGDGQDTIQEYWEANYGDRIVFGNNISWKDAEFSKIDNNLIIQLKENGVPTSDKITILGCFDGQQYTAVDQFVFYDGTITFDGIKQMITFPQLKLTTISTYKFRDILTASDGNIYALAYKNNLPYLLRSTNMIDWTELAQASSYEVDEKLVEFNGALYYGSVYRIYRYQNGSTDIVYSNSTNNYVYSVVGVFDGKLYAVSRDYGKVLTSEDGTNWVEIGDMPNYLSHTGIQFQGNIYLSEGYINPSSSYTYGSGLVYKYDGTTWSTAADLEDRHVMSFEVHNNVLYAGVINANLIYKTVDGITWEKIADLGGSYMNLKSFNGNLYAVTSGYRAFYRLNPTTQVWDQLIKETYVYPDKLIEFNSKLYVMSDTSIYEWLV